MKSAVETLSPTRAKLTVEVPFEELKPSLDAAYKKIAQQINVPGFRRGKVPPAVIDRQVGRGAGPRRGDQRRRPAAVHGGAAGERPRAAGPAGDRGDEVRGQRVPRVHRRGRRQARVRAALPTTASRPSVDDVEISDADVDEQVEALRERFGTLTDGRARGRRRRLRHHRPDRRQGRRGRRGRRGHRHVLQGRPRRHDRRPRRGPGRPVRRRREDVRPPSSSAATWSARPSRSPSR